PGEMARSDPRPSARVTRGAGSGQHSRLSCKSAGKTRTLMPVWDSSGESRFERSLSCPNAASACSSRQLSTLLSRSAADVGGQVTRSIWSSNKTSAISSDGKSDNSRVIFVFLVRPERLRESNSQHCLGHGGG